MMWLARSVLIRLIIDARDVDFPEPVGPVTSTRPAMEVGERIDRRLASPDPQGSISHLVSNAIQPQPSHVGRRRLRGSARDLASGCDVSKLTAFFEAGPLISGQDLIDDPTQICRHLDSELVHRQERAVNADHWRRSSRQVKVGTLHFDQLLQEIVEVDLVAFGGGLALALRPGQGRTCSTSRRCPTGSRVPS